MRTVYATQFNLTQKEGCSETCIDCLMKKMTSWISGKYKGAWKTDFSPAFNVAPQRPIENHQVVAKHSKLSGAEYFEIEWEHPDEKDPSLRWIITCIGASLNNQVQFALMIKVGSASFVIKPLEFDVGRPRVITDIFKACPCAISGFDLAPNYLTLKTEDVEDFYRSTLISKDRPLPVVIVSLDQYSEKPIIDIDELHDALLGQAQVVLLEDKWASFKLSEIIGNQLSAYRGAVRLYWPGLNENSSPFEHPLFLPDKIKRLKDRGQSFSKFLFKKLTTFSSFRHSEGSIVKEVKKLAEEERRAQIQDLRDKLKKTEDYDALLDELEKSWQENKTLQSEKETLAQRVEELEETVEKDQENLRYLSKQVARESEQSDEVAVVEEDEEIKTVIEALERAEEDFSNDLKVFDAAKASARKSGFSRPNQVYQALMAISEVSREYFESISNGEPMGPWEDAFARRGFKYKSGESEMTMNMHGNERQFTHEGVTKQMVKHITIGGGDRM